jgi:helix-turn-helix protein
MYDGQDKHMFQLLFKSINDSIVAYDYFSIGKMRKLRDTTTDGRKLGKV